MTSAVGDKEKSDAMYHGHVCNDCLAIYLSSDDFERHAKEKGHDKNAIKLDVFSCTRISDHKVVVLFKLPKSSPFPDKMWSIAE